MTAHAAIAAVPKTGTGNPNATSLQAYLVTRVAWIIGDAEDPQAFDPRGQDGSPVTLVLGYQGQWFWFDEADTTTGHDGTTCIVTTATGGRYKVNDINLLITKVISKTTTTPPGSPANGDAYIVPSASTGAWATWTKSIAVWVEARSEWFRILPKAGWFVSVPGSTRDVVYRYDSVQADWITGDGATAAADTVPLSAIIGMAASPKLRVQNQTQYAPPGARVTGGTPTMPLGGTAANINDNSDATIGTTSAIGDLTGLQPPDTLFAQIDLGSVKSLIAVEIRGHTRSASSSAAQLYTSSDGVTWTAYGANFTSSTISQNVMRTGAVSARYVAVGTQDINHGGATLSLSGLNAFTADISASVGDAYIIAATAIGVFAGHENKVAICEVANTFTIYTPQPGDEAYDIALGIDYEYRGSAWQSAAGAWQQIVAPVETMGTGSTTSFGSGSVDASYYSYSTGTAPTTSQYGRTDDITISATARRSGAYIRLRYRAFLTLAASGIGDTVSSTKPVVIGVIRDSESDAIKWVKLAAVSSADGSFINPDLIDVEFIISASDTSAHTYKIAIWSGAWNNGTSDDVIACTVIENRLLTAEVGG